MKIIQSDKQNDLFYLMGTQGLCLKGVYRCFGFPDNKDKWSVDLVKDGQVLDSYFEEATEPMTEELGKAILDRAVDSFESIIDKYMKKEGEADVQDGICDAQPERYVYVYDKRPNEQGEYVVKTFDCMTKREVPEERVTFDSLDEMLKVVKASEDDGYVNKDLGNVIFSAPTMETFKKWESEKTLFDSKKVRDSMYLFPPLTEEDIKTGATKYNLIFKSHPSGDIYALGSKENIKKFAKEYLDYELHPSYLEDSSNDSYIVASTEGDKWYDENGNPGTYEKAKRYKTEEEAKRFALSHGNGSVQKVNDSTEDEEYYKALAKNTMEVYYKALYAKPEDLHKYSEELQQYLKNHKPEDIKKAFEVYTETDPELMDLYEHIKNKYCS